MRTVCLDLIVFAFYMCALHKICVSINDCIVHFITYSDKRLIFFASSLSSSYYFILFFIHFLLKYFTCNNVCLLNKRERIIQIDIQNVIIIVLHYYLSCNVLCFFINLSLVLYLLAALFTEFLFIVFSYCRFYH